MIQQLISAISSGDIETLINVNVEVWTDLRDDQGYNLLHWCAYCDECNILASLLQRIPDNSQLQMISFRSPVTGNTALHLAAAQSSLRVLHRICSNYSDSINIQNRWGETSLHVAASSGNEVCISALLLHKADISLKDNWGRTPYQVAIENGYIKDNEVYASLKYEYSITVTVLPAELEDEDHKYRRGELVKELMHFVENRKPCEPVEVEVKHIFKVAAQPLVSSQNSTRIAISKRLEYPGDVNELVAMLSRREEFDVNGKDMYGLTALHKCSAWDKVDLLELLLGDPDIDVNVKSTVEWSCCLHSCVEMRARRTLSRLLNDERVDFLAQNKQGLTAREVAESNADLDFVALFKDEEKREEE